MQGSLNELKNDNKSLDAITNKLSRDGFYFDSHNLWLISLAFSKTEKKAIFYRIISHALDAMEEF